MSVEALTPVIKGILTAPDVDLRTISAKRVRKQILQQDPSLSETWIKDNKEQIDKLIGSIFEEVAAASAKAISTPEAVNGKRKHEEIEHVPTSSPEKPISVPRPMSSSTATPRPPSSKPPVKKAESSNDEQYARQLAAELNAPRTRSGSDGKRPTKKAKTKKKSAAEVGSDGEGEDAPKKVRKGGFQKEYTLSTPLAQLIGSPKLSRPQVVKKVWEHIKGNNLQDPENRREIICDEMMKAVFNVDRINMFQMNKVMGSHLYEDHES